MHLYKPLLTLPFSACQKTIVIRKYAKCMHASSTSEKLPLEKKWSHKSFEGEEKEIKPAVRQT